jgi:Uma2 family endonuclease
MQNESIPYSQTVTEGLIQEEDKKMSSKNHGLIQARLASFINLLDDYNVATELSLDVSETQRQDILTKYGFTATRELKPDIAVYRAEEFDLADPDADDDLESVDPLRVQQMPLCAMEIVSPSQSSYKILQKFRAYFAMGVKSCWLVEPNLKTIVVYQGQIRQKRSYLANNGGEVEVEDSILKVKMPLAKIFGKKIPVKPKLKTTSTLKNRQHQGNFDTNSLSHTPSDGLRAPRTRQKTIRGK